MVEAIARIPRRPLVAMGGNAAGILQHPRQMHQVPGHERRVALGEVVVDADTVIAIGRARSGLADPARIGLRRDDIAQMLKR